MKLFRSRQQIGANVRLVWCCSSIEVVSNRDVKGLYFMATHGKIQGLVGFSKNGVAFDEPGGSDLTLDKENETRENR